MAEKKKKPKIRIPLPKKIEKTHRDKTRYTRKKKHKNPEEIPPDSKRENSA